MYLSHPIYRMRDDLLSDETAALRVKPADGDARIMLESRVESPDGSLKRELQFGSIVVSFAELAVSDLCGSDGIRRIETVDVLGC